MVRASTPSTETLAGRHVGICIEQSALLLLFDPETRELLRTRPNPWRPARPSTSSAADRSGRFPGLGRAGHRAAACLRALRHFYASVLLDGGESIKALSEYLGHSDPGFTLRTYTHLMPSSSERTRRAVDAVLGSNGPDEAGNPAPPLVGQAPGSRSHGI